MNFFEVTLSLKNCKYASINDLIAIREYKRKPGNDSFIHYSFIY